MAKKYRTGGYGGQLITELEILRETASTIWFMEEWYGKKTEQRAKKDGSYHQFHDSWEAARDYLLAAAQRKVENVKANLQRARSELGQVESLKNPVPMAAELNQSASPLQSIQESPEKLEQDVAK